MADDAQKTPEQKNGGNGDFTPPATQEELNAIIKARIERERKKFEDYDELKAKAARLDEIEEANRSDLEKAVRRAEKAEKEAAELRKALSLRAIADEFGIGKDDLDFIDGPDEDTIRAKAERFSARLREQKEQKEQQDGTPRVGFTLDGAQPPVDSTPGHEEAARAFFGI